MDNAMRCGPGGGFVGLIHPGYTESGVAANQDVHVQPSFTQASGFAPLPMVRAAKAVPVAAGEQSVTAQVSMVWEIH